MYGHNQFLYIFFQIYCCISWDQNKRITWQCGFISAVPEVTQKASSMPGNDHEFYLTSAKRMKTFCKWPYLTIVSPLPQVLCDQVPSHGETQANDLGWGVALQEVNHHTVIVPCVTAREDPRRCHLEVMRYAHYTNLNKLIKALKCFAIKGLR